MQTAGPNKTKTDTRAHSVSQNGRVHIRFCMVFRASLCSCVRQFNHAMVHLNVVCPHNFARSVCRFPSTTQSVSSRAHVRHTRDRVVCPVFPVLPECPTCWPEFCRVACCWVDYRHRHCGRIMHASIRWTALGSAECDRETRVLRPIWFHPFLGAIQSVPHTGDSIRYRELLHTIHWLWVVVHFWHSIAQRRV